MTKQIYKAHDLGINQTMVNSDALKVILKLQERGFHAYIVGGGVRDLILGRQPKDFDIVTDAIPEQVRKLFNRNSMIIGRRFKLVHVFYEHFNEQRSLKIGRAYFDRHTIEVSTYRALLVHGCVISEHGRVLLDNEYGGMDDDAHRRDFTVNALYYDPILEKVYDYHKGVIDLKDRMLRIIGNPYERYLEDPVRVLRAIRLSEKLGLTIDERTYINFRNVKHLLLNEPKGRLFEEMLKILQSGNSSNIIHELDELGMPRRVFPIFDRIFFHNNHELFAGKILEKTDLRIAANEDISVVFILAGLCWTLINKDLQNEIKHGLHPRQALIEALLRNKSFIFNSGLTRSLYAAMREIWMLQIDFDMPKVANLDSLVHNQRFRQAWHLFNLRAEFLEVDPQVFALWKKYMDAEIVDKTELLVEFADMLPLSTKKPKKPRKNHRKKSSKVNLSEEYINE